jgi:protein tyrosine/serine phosphatase
MIKKITGIQGLVLFISIFATSNGFAECITDNFHEVEPHSLYRSAQLSAQTLQEKITSLGLKTIINLRGANPTESWFVAETQVAQKNNVEMVNISLSANSIPSKDQLVTLLEAYDKAPRPILVHCEGGADRTGMATAIYEYDKNNGNLHEADDMLSIFYFHIEWIHPAMDYFVNEIYRGYQWAMTDFDPCAENYKYFNKAAFCKAPTTP